MVKQTLLLVDGDVQSLRVLEVSLRDAGFAVHTARNGAEALTKAASVPPDLILTDTALPVLDGFELCKRLKADPALGDAALVFLSERMWRTNGDTKKIIREPWPIPVGLRCFK